MKNHTLKIERRRLGWSQRGLAKILGVTTRTVIRWERGLTVPHPNHRRRLGTLFGKTAEELGLFWDADEVYTVERPLPSNIPQTLGSIGGLLGRTELFMQAKVSLLEGGNLALTALDGLPGIGKTALAEALTRDRQVRLHFFDGILWASLGRQPHILGQLMRWGALLGVAPSDVENPESCESWSQTLRSAIGCRQMLLVIDDAWTAEDALALQIGGVRCASLLTTRDSQVALAFAERRSIAVPRLEEADGLVLLTRFVPQIVQQDPEGARSLVQAVGCLPLALNLLGHYLALLSLTQHPRPLQVALAQLQETEQRMRLSMSANFSQNWPSLAGKVPLSLYAVIAICDQHLSPQAQTALCDLSIFSPKPHYFSREAALSMSQQPIETLDALCGAGLLENWGQGRYSLHQAVVDYLRAKIISQMTVT